MDPEVEFLSYYLKTNTRKIDRGQYLITYRELEKLLKRYDSWLENPHGNTIDVMHWEKVETRGFFGKIRESKEIRRACKIGFPGWTRQVGKGRLKHIRDSLRLTPEHGVDAQAFFRDLDDMKVLLELYEGALQRLASR